MNEDSTLMEVRKAFIEHVAQDDERFNEILEHLKYLREAVDWLVKAEKTGEKVDG